MASASLPVIYLPLSTIPDPFFRHAGDTFREVVGMWEEMGLIDVVLTQNVYVWLGEEETEQGVVLYDRPTMEWWKRRTPQRYKCALFGNQQPAASDGIQRAFPWFFWARRPKMLEDYANSVPLNGWDDRPLVSIFLGKIENQVQQAFRDTNRWKECIQEFELVLGKQTQYKYTQIEYLKQLHKARYGLCLRGYGPKCNREIELMALGTVPLVAPEVDMTGYFDQPKEGLHYFRVSSPEDVTRIVEGTTREQWELMSRSCRDWYLRNCSAVGSFYQTMRLVNTLSTSTLIGKPMSQAWSVPQPKIAGVKRVVIDTVFFERPFSGISRVWMGLLNQLISVRAELLLQQQHPIEIVLLFRAGAAQIAQTPGILQAFSFVGIPSFSYGKLNEEVQHLDEVCKRLQADLFISTYYTYCSSDAATHGCLAVVHDMIPEHFKMAKNAMWQQKDACLANASWYWCISEFTRSELIRYCPTATVERTSLVYNSFDPVIFSGVDEVLSDSTEARNKLKNELDVDLPFIVVVSSNSEQYKNFRLISDMVRMQPGYFSHVTVVVLCNNQLPTIQGAKIKVLHGISDKQLGLLYGMASAMIYPSKLEGFGLPALEAYWSECPVICCERSGAVPEIAGDGCFYVPQNDPAKLFEVVEAIVAGHRDDEVRTKAAIGLELVQTKFTPQQQLQQMIECMYAAMGVQTEDCVWNTNASKALKKQVSEENHRTKFDDDMSTTTTPTESVAAAVATPTFEGIHVLVQYFVGNDEDRQAEYDFCVQANLANPQVARVHCLVEKDADQAKFPEWLTGSEKVRIVPVPSRLTYKQAFDYANSKLSGHVVAVSNLDIFLDHNSEWQSAQQLFEMSIVLCLSRHEFNGVDASTKDEKLQNLAYANAQDCWMFRAPIFVKDCDFQMGKLGCDNAIAHRINASGYIPVNSPNEFKIHHFDVCRGKRGDNFLGHHTPNPEYPEDRGYMLLPDYSALARIGVTRRARDPKTGQESEERHEIISIDELIERMGLGQIHRYRVACDIMSQYIRLSNPRPSQMEKK